MSDAFLQSFRKELAQARKERRSSDLVDFVRSHWRLFCASRSKMSALVEELEQRDVLNIDGLADALGLPDFVLFKRTSVPDTVRAFVDGLKSSLVQAMLKASARRAEASGRSRASVCLVAVCGEHTVVLTNMPVERDDGSAMAVIDQPDGYDIHVFRADRAPARLPGLFNHTGDQDE